MDGDEIIQTIFLGDKIVPQVGTGIFTEKGKFIITTIGYDCRVESLIDVFVYAVPN